MVSPIVTLTTDWGSKDFFAGMVKGRLYSMIDNVRVVDITHNIEPFSQGCASFIIKQACLGFPPGTIHIIDVNTIEDKDTPFIVVLYKEQYYICTDNGLPYSVFGDDFTMVVQTNVYQDSNFYTFGAYHLFCKIAKLLADDTPLEELGVRVDALKHTIPLQIVQQGDLIVSYIQYIDNYGNAYLNLTYDRFMEILGNRRFEMRLKGNKVSTISTSYMDDPYVEKSHPTQILLTVSSTGFLQIAVQKASAQQLLGLHVLDQINITLI